MRPRHLLYGFIAIAAGFAGVMAYLLYSAGAEGGGAARPAAAARLLERIAFRGSRAVRPGKLTIAYTGDIKGSLGPCG